MKPTGRFTWGALVLALLIVVAPGADGWVGAATSGLGRSDLESAAALRQNLGAVITEFTTIVQLAPVQPEIVAMLDEARLRLAQVPDSELAVWAPELEAKVEHLRTAAAGFRTALQSRAQATEVQSQGLPNADYPTVNWTFVIDAFTDIGNIPTSAGNTSVSGLCNYLTNPTPNQQFYYLNMDIATEALRDTADRLCSFVGSIVGEGGSLSLVCIVTDLLYMVQKSIKENWFLCGSVMGAAEVRASYYRIGHIHDDLATAEGDLHDAIAAAELAVSAELGQTASSIIDLGDDLALHDQSLTAHADQVDQALEAHRQAIIAFQGQSLRHHIEQRLSEADHGPLALFFLPDTVGGQIETVRDIVFDTIGQAAAGGQDVHQAEKLFAAGDEALSELDFKSAYDLFGRAYRAALN